MAIRYLVYWPTQAGNAASSDEIRLPDFTRLLAGPTQRVFVSGDHLILPNNGGIILGHLFEAGAAMKKLEALNGEFASNILRTRGQSLMTSHWGGYVAFLNDPQTGEFLAVRDPSGALPCYYLETPAGIAISSDVETLYQAGLLHPQIDWIGLLQHLTAVDFRRPRTALMEVTELLAGFRLSSRGAAPKAEAIWSPWVHTNWQDKGSEDAQINVRTVVDHCTEQWARAYQRIGVSLSGGLDSSIVSMALRSRRKSLALVTMATDEGEGDERCYARQVADALRLPLTERFYDISKTDVTRSASSHLPRPILCAVAQGEMAIKREVEIALGLDAYFAGHGGDNVFCNISSVTPIVDRLRHDGISSGTLNTFNDVCQLTGCSTWQAVSGTWNRLRRANASYHWRPEVAFLNPKLLNQQNFTMTHPWLDAPSQVLPGKAVHVAMLLRIQGSLDGFSRAWAPQINPLLSQPVVEACLSVPTWQWIAGGRDRSIAREAYADLLPRAITERRSKGGPESFAYRIIDQNRDVIRERLLDGILAAHDLLDLDALRSVFDSPLPIAADQYFRLSFLAEAEAWARHWTALGATRPARPAA